MPTESSVPFIINHKQSSALQSELYQTFYNVIEQNIKELLNSEDVLRSKIIILQTITFKTWQQEA